METYKLIRAARRTLAMELSPEGKLILRAPRRMPISHIERFMQSHETWIREHREKIRRRADFDREHFGAEEQIAALMAQAKAILPGKTPMGVRLSRDKKRIGSCSAENRIAYSYRLMAYPEEVIDYVVVHELAHIRHKNHSADFYAFVARFLPDYKAREAILKHK